MQYVQQIKPSPELQFQYFYTNKGPNRLATEAGHY